MKEAKYKALELAYCMVEYTHKKQLECYLSPLKMSKLLYVAQGLSLAIYHQPLFKDEIKKCKYGVRIEEVDKAFLKSYGGNTIPSTYLEVNYMYWAESIFCSIPYYRRYLVHPDCHDMFALAYYKNEELDEITRLILEQTINKLVIISNTELLKSVIFDSWAYQVSGEIIDLDYLKIEYISRLTQGE